MKQLFLVLSIILFSNALISQDEAGDTEIKQTFEAYFLTVKNKDNAATLEYLYPKMFDFFPKEALLDMMDQMSSDTTMKMDFFIPELHSISDVLTLEGISYALLSYSFTMNIQLNLEDEDEIGDEEDSLANITLNMYKEMFGEENVKFIKEESTFEIRTNSELYAIDDPEFKGWKFLEKKENMKPLLEQILPAVVLEQF